MARRKNPNSVDIWLDRVAMLPWWGWLGIAIAAYAVGTGFASWGLAGAVLPGQEAVAGATPAWKSLASLGPYLVTSVCLAGAATSALRRRPRRNAMADAGVEDAALVVKGMTLREFEALLAQAFRKQGYHVTETGGGGVDMVLRKDRETLLVQCKHWQAARVGIEHIEALSQVVRARGVAGAFAVTSGRFSREAAQYAGLQNVRMIDGPVLLGLLAQGKAARTEGAAPSA